MKLKIKIRLLNDEENLNMMKKNKYYNLLKFYSIKISLI